MDNKLKAYMRDNFDFPSMKEVGIFPKEMKFNDYEGQAKIICHIFGLVSVYEYSNIGRGCYAHLSYVNPTPFTRFVEPIGPPLMKIEGKEGKVITITKSKMDNE